MVMEGGLWSVIVCANIIKRHPAVCAEPMRGPRLQQHSPAFVYSEKRQETLRKLCTSSPKNILTLGIGCGEKNSNSLMKQMPPESPVCNEVIVTHDVVPVLKTLYLACV
jgi:hypothetical protein